MIDRPRSSDPPTTPAALAAWAAIDSVAARRCLQGAEYWHSLLRECGLHVSDGPPLSGSAEHWVSVSDERVLTAAREAIAERGYFQLERLVDPDRCVALAAGVSTLCRHGWDASFIALTDEVWQLCARIAELMEHVLGADMLFRREISAFCVDPVLAAGRARGVPAHRDRPDSGYENVDRRAMPRHCTCWLSLTGADEANGCMYVVPARADDAAALATPATESARGLALPTRPGDLLAWSGQAIHWGGQFDRTRARSSRIAIALSLTHARIPSIGDFTPVQSDALPAFAERLSLVATLFQWLNPPAKGSAMESVLPLIRSPS